MSVLKIFTLMRFASEREGAVTRFWPSIRRNSWLVGDSSKSSARKSPLLRKERTFEMATSGMGGVELTRSGSLVKSKLIEKAWLIMFISSDWEGLEEWAKR